MEVKNGNTRILLNKADVLVENIGADDCLLSN